MAATLLVIEQPLVVMYNCGVDIDAVRTFVSVADTGQFQEAAAELAITQQAASKRIAVLEKDLQVQLFTRTARGAELTLDGQALLPHARELLRVEARASDSVRPGRRALRVDVIGQRLVTAGLLRRFAEGRPGTDVDAVTLLQFDDAVAAVVDGTIDAAFRAVTMPGRRLPHEVRSLRVADEPLQLLAGPDHALAGRAAITMADLSGHRIWMPGAVAGTEWRAFYDELASTFDLTIEATGPNDGTEALFDAIADSPGLATIVGGSTRLVWPTRYGLRRIPLVDPTPVYPHSLLWRAENRHPVLRALVEHLDAARTRDTESDTWVPAWATRR
jgi:DNA-binding transcriptional LysR family regulator